MKLNGIYGLVLAAGLLPWTAGGCGNADLPAAAAGRQSGASSTSSSKPDEGNPFAADSPTPGEPASNASKASPSAPAARSARLPAAAGRADITFDDIKFDLDKKAEFKRSMLTPKIEALDGRQVLIRGYILPSFQQTGLTQFVLVRDNMQCCFGPGAALYDCIVVEMKPGVSTNFTVRPVAVQGTFAIREFLDPDGKPLAIYHMDGESVQ